ncbi:MAG: MmgE/PrpD family protein [Planctomycetota bacterium]|jgi:2-methylcitrate dehydratase|nr:MmgE/PrpD family protein [Planctomycetota bacterium]
MSTTQNTILLPRSTNQARGLARYCRDFLTTPRPIGAATLARLEAFHLDSVGCGVSALAAEANAPTVLRREALATRPTTASRGGICFGSPQPCATEKAVAANASAVREWDSNGTNFGYDAAKGRTAGEFGHNDYYPVAIAAAREAGLDGDTTLRLMLLIDEIRGRLAEVFALRKYAIDHVHHGTVACAAAYAAALGGSEDQIESAIGMAGAHYVPFRAIRAGHQLSDSKGASAALAAEAAVLCARRALAGFIGPPDIFRNPLALYRINEPCPDDESPFDLELGVEGDAFAINMMHFKLGLYEHQSAGALQSLVDLFISQPELATTLDAVQRIRVAIYEPAYSIIADPAKRSPTTRQSADHSLPFILAKTLLKARVARARGELLGWESLMLLPDDYSDTSISDPEIKRLIARIEIAHGGSAYDAKYPEGIPTSVTIEHETLGLLGGVLAMFPLGHARSDAAQTAAVVNLKFERLVADAVDDPASLRKRLAVGGKSATAVAELYAFPIGGIVT